MCPKASRADFQVRKLAPDDSIEELTLLLHRAYESLARQGMRFLATHQSADMTAERIQTGTCFVATTKGRVVGTVCVYLSDPASECEHYRKPGTCHFGQYAVEPQLQGKGIGKALLDAAMDYARQTGATDIALDTAETAHDLISLYETWGFRVVGKADWDETNYESVIMSRPL